MTTPNADPPHPLPVAFKIVIPSTNPPAPTNPPRDALHLPAQTPCDPPVPPSPRPNSLDTQETSVADSVVRSFLAAEPEPPRPPPPSTWKEMLLNSIGAPGPEDNFIHSGWASLRKKISDAMFRTAQSDSRIRSFLTCGRGGWIERATANHDRTRLRIPYCHDRMCMVCGNHRSHRIRDALLTQMANQPVSFITLTLCGRGESLTELLDRLYKGFRALRAHPRWADKVRGGAAILEVKWSDKAKRWHPHLHIIADADYLPQAELSDIWRGITRDSYIVDIKRVKNADVAGRYVAKYASKPMDTTFTTSPLLLDQAMVALKGRRLCLCFGTWHGTPLSVAEDVELADDMIDAAGYEKHHPLWLVLQEANAGNREMIELLINTPGAEAAWRRSLENSS